jgi:hypothetical protein
VWVFFVIGGKNCPGPVVLVCTAYVRVTCVSIIWSNNSIGLWDRGGYKRDSGRPPCNEFSKAMKTTPQTVIECNIEA